MNRNRNVRLQMKLRKIICRIQEDWCAANACQQAGEFEQMREHLWATLDAADEAMGVIAEMEKV